MYEAGTTGIAILPGIHDVRWAPCAVAVPKNCSEGKMTVAFNFEHLGCHEWNIAEDEFVADPQQ